MIISDKQLSAFLDAQLPAPEMDAIRSQLISDEQLADRLADLALVDELVAACAQQIDGQAVPAKTTALFQGKAVAPMSAKILEFPALKRVKKILQQPSAIAASVALVLGFGVAQLVNEQNLANTWQVQAGLLETSPSGLVQVVDKNLNLKPRVSFKNKAGNFCRLFDLTQGQVHSENIACRNNGKWLLVTSAVQNISLSDDYRPASGGSLLESTVDQMIDGDILNAPAEAAAMQKNWRD